MYLDTVDGWISLSDTFKLVDQDRVTLRDYHWPGHQKLLKMEEVGIIRKGKIRK